MNCDVCVQAISFDIQSRRHASKWDQLYKVLRRACILFGLGLIVSNQVHQPRYLRIMGKCAVLRCAVLCCVLCNAVQRCVVFDDALHNLTPLHPLLCPHFAGVLQRFAVSYLLVSLVMLLIPRRSGAASDGFELHSGSAGPCSALCGGNSILGSDLTDYAWEWVVVLGWLATHLGLTFGLEVPGCGKGYLGPGGPLVDGGSKLNCTGGAAGYIDKQLLGTAHMYQTPTCFGLYQTGAYGMSAVIVVAHHHHRNHHPHTTHSARVLGWAHRLCTGWMGVALGSQHHPVCCVVLCCVVLCCDVMCCDVM